MNISRGLLLGAGFGLCVSIAEATLLTVQIAQIGIPSPVGVVLNSAILDVLCGALLGAILSPLLHYRAGALWVLLGLTAFWVGSGLLVLPGTFFVFIIVIPAVGGLVLAGLGLALARRSRVLATCVGVGVWTVAVLSVELVALGAESNPPVAGGPPLENAPDIVLIVLDTVRAQNVSAYGYARPTTPTFDALAAEGALFLDATAPATWSLPSHASLFTGRFPSSHGAHAENSFLEATSTQLPEALSAAGYETAVFTANPWISDSLGLTRGFQVDDEAWRSGGGFVRLANVVFRITDWLGFGSDDKGGASVAGRFSDWLAARPQDGPPLFVFLNFVEAHFPYHIVPEEQLAQFTSVPRAELRDLSILLTSNQFARDPVDVDAAIGPATDMYDAGILYSDELLRRTVEAVRTHRSLDNTILVVLSDHGELIGEHGAFGHGGSLIEVSTRVPFSIRYPARIPAGTRVETPVSTLGVYGTLLDLIGVDPPVGLQVGSLMPVMTGGPPGGPVLAEVFARTDDDPDHTTPLVRRSVRWRSYRAGTLKLIESSAGELYLFDLATDPNEENNLAQSDPAKLATLRDELDTWLLALGMPPLDAVVAASEPVDLDPAARQRLRDLGYIE